MNQVHTTVAMHQQPATTLFKISQFVRHFLEMCAAMCIGAAVLGLVYSWAAGRVGVSNAYVQYPELSALVLAFNMTAPMVVWMRYRAWQPIAEMSGVMVVEAVAIVVLYWLGALRKCRCGQCLESLDVAARPDDARNAAANASAAGLLQRRHAPPGARRLNEGGHIAGRQL